MKNAGAPQETASRPPIVVVLGHVDHGKTTLLDSIRKTNVATGEAGGITQKIGAYQIEISNPKSKTPNKITFIDTPGHEAFSKMRVRGANVADIAVLVVGANDGVKPQTEESIQHILAAKIPYVVAINKIDLPEADPKKVKQQLAKKDVLVEELGGQVVAHLLSAKTGKGVPELLDVILLLSEMNGIKGRSSGPAAGVIIEATQDKHRGNIATVIVREGILNIGDTIFAENVKCKVKAMFDDRGQSVTQANPGTPVLVMGWERLPEIGSVVTEIESSKNAQSETSIPTVFALPPLDETRKLKVILKTDATGSLEAIVASFPKAVDVVAQGVGEITESDVMLAKSTGAFVIGFNVKPMGRVAKLATLEGVRIKNYSLIYELLEQISEVVELLNQPVQEDILGEAEIIAQFAAQGEPVAGCVIKEGRIVRNDLVRIMRQQKEMGKGRVKSIRHLKDDISKAEKGTECGVIFDKKLDFRPGDRIIAYKIRDLLT